MNELAPAFSRHGFLAAQGVAGAPFAERVAEWLQAATGAFLHYGDWFVLAVSSFALAACLFLALGPARRIRLGGPQARPEFGFVSWIAMLFAAGMGAGLVFWGAAEPLLFAETPPPMGALESYAWSEAALEPASEEARRRAMALAMLHWGLHPWAIYALSAAAVGFFAYRRAQVTGEDAAGHLLPSAPLHAPGAVRGGAREPLVRRAIDWIALLGVVFGIVASLGNGVRQLNAGAASVTGASQTESLPLQFAFLAVLAAAYLISAASGVRRGIRILSDINLALALGLVVFVLWAGPALSILKTAAIAAYDYARALPGLAFELRRGGGEAAAGWTQAWSLTYFLWWIAWIPFVGVFVARISYGRTLGAFMAGVLGAPVLITLVWFSVFGAAAFDLQYNQGADLGIAGADAAQIAIFRVLGEYPAAALTQTLATLLVFVFLVTSADSGAYVLAMLARGGDPRPPIRDRLFWGVLLALLTALALAAAGGHAVMRAFAVAGAAPMVFILAWQGLRLVGVAGFKKAARGDIAPSRNTQ